MIDFCHLHVHTEYSTLDGHGNCDAYAKRASQLGFEYLACTDHGSIDGLIKFQQACTKHEITPILGCEAYVSPEINKERTNGHMVLLVKNKRGFTNLCKILSFSNQEGFYYKPRVTFEYLLNHSAGLIISSACHQSYLNLPGGISFLKELIHTVGKVNVCLEVMPQASTAQRAHNRKIIRLARKHAIKVIATNDCHYVKRKEAIAQEVLLAIQTKATWDQENRYRFDLNTFYLRSERAMSKAMKLSRLPRQYMENTIDIAERCSDFEIQKRTMRLPMPLKVKDEDEYLRSQCLAGYKEIFGKNIHRNRKYFKRFKTELNLIISKKFTRYFLIVYDFVQWCKDNDVLIGPSRGSVGCSLVAFLLGITIIDSVKWNLPMDRFINADRLDFPDIDLDIEDTKRQLVWDYLTAKYGASKVAGISTFSRMKPKAAIGDVARVFKVPVRDTMAFTSTIDSKTDLKLDYLLTTTEGEIYKEKYPKVARLALMLEGQIRQKSKHAAGIVVNNRSIANSGKCNVIIRNKTTMINWEKEDAEFMGFTKLDILSLKLLSILGYGAQMIKENTDKNIIFKKISLEDEAVLRTIHDGKTVGMFQLSPYATTRVLTRAGVQKFEDLVAAVALARPGPSNSGMTKEYIKRKHGGTWNEKHIIYESITSNTYGLLVYQEQVMAVIHEVAGLPYSTADQIRKVIGKKRDPKEFAKYKKQFVDGCRSEKTFSRDEAKAFWKGLQEWAKYGFNLAHSIGYAMLGYWSAWLKYYYPTEFICASLTYGAKEKKPELIEEAFKLNLKLILPMVYGNTHPTDWKAKGKKLYIPFFEVKTIGEVKAHQAKTVGAQIQKSHMLFGEEVEEAPSTHKGAFKKLLESIDAYRDDEHVRVNDEMRSKFDFRITH